MITEPVGIVVGRADKSKYDHVIITKKVSREPDYVAVYESKTIYFDDLTSEQKFLVGIFEQVNNKLLESFGVMPWIVNE